MFNNQPTLSDGTLHLSPLCAAHRAGLRLAASDPSIWADHPAPDRYRPAVFNAYFDKLLAFKSALVIRHDDTTIGCSAYYTASDQPGTLSIGYTFLTRAHWGDETNLRVKTLMLVHAFQSYDPVWLHIGPQNIRSQKATVNLGAVYSHTATSDTGVGPTRAQYYKLTRSAWRDRIGQ